MATVSKRMYCPSCSAEVETVLAGRGPDGKPLVKCTICGSAISAVAQAAAPADKTISLDEISFTDEAISVPTLDTVLVAGYPPTVRQILVDKLVDKQLAREVVPLANAEDAIVSIIGGMSAKGNNGRVDLLVLDVPMPFLNGINAAIGLRAIERSYKDHDLIPILFLTNKPCDDTFKKVIKYLAPAKYATLGPVDDRDKFLKHVQRIIALLAQERW
jgi:CheY-like chemotaxis protein